MTVKQAWDIADGEVVYPIPKPCISLINNPINSTVGLFFLMWKLNDPFLAHARKCLSESEITPNGSHDPENPNGPITIGQEMQKICEEAMNKCTKYSYIIPEELKEIKQCGPIVTPPLMHRKSDW